MTRSSNEDYRPIEKVGFDIERAAWAAGYTTWVEWAAADLDAANRALDEAGVEADEVVDDKEK